MIFNHLDFINDCFTPDDVGLFLLSKIPALDGQVDWIGENDINGVAFNFLSRTDLEKFGISSWGIQTQILANQAPSALSNSRRIEGKHIRKVSKVFFSLLN